MKILFALFVISALLFYVKDSSVNEKNKVNKSYVTKKVKKVEKINLKKRHIINQLKKNNEVIDKNDKENKNSIKKLSDEDRKLCRRVPCPQRIRGKATNQSCKVNINLLSGKKYASCECDEGSMRKMKKSGYSTHFCSYECKDITCVTGECAYDENGGIFCECKHKDDVQKKQSCLPKKCSKNYDCNGYYGGEFCNVAIIDFDIRGPQKTSFRCGPAIGTLSLNNSCDRNQNCKSGLCLDGKCSTYCNSTSDCLSFLNDNKSICEMISSHFNPLDHRNTFSYENICRKMKNTYKSSCSKNSIDLCSDDEFCAHNVLDFKTIDSDSKIEYLCLSKVDTSTLKPCYGYYDCKYGVCMYKQEVVSKMCTILDMGKCINDKKYCKYKCLNNPSTECTRNSDCRKTGLSGGTCVYRAEGDECSSSSECSTQICSITKDDSTKRCRKACMTDYNCENGSCKKVLPYNSGFSHAKTTMYDNGDYLQVCEYE